jgi:transposase
MKATEIVEDNRAAQGDDATLLQTTITALQHDKTALELQNESLRATIVQLRHEITLFRKRLYGLRTEKLATAEMQLMLGDLLKNEAELQRQLDAQVAAAQQGVSGDDDDKPSPRGKPSGRRDLSASTLPQVVVEFDDAALEAQGCTRIGVEESRQLMYQPASHAVLVKRVVKYAKPVAPDAVETTVVTAAAPPTMFARGMLHTSMVAQLVVGKFALGTPNYRVEKFIEHHVTKIDRGMMSRYQEDAGNTYGATVVAAMWRDAITNCGVISTDATGGLIQPVKTSGDKLPRGCTKGHFFTAVADEEHVLFAYLEKHTQVAVAKLFEGFNGFLQADASAVYHLMDKGRQPVVDDESPAAAQGATLVGCWAHLRRYFYEAAICKYPVGVRGLLRIRAVYAADNQFTKLSPDNRHAMRQLHVRPLIDDFFAWIEQARRENPDRTLASKALGYAHNQADELRRVLDDPHLPLDNTRAERSLRTIVIGNKNWMFYGSDIHAQAAAALFTLIASCRLHKLDTQRYLDETMRLVPQWPRDRFLELAPSRWLATRAKLDQAELAAPLAHFAIPPI